MINTQKQGLLMTAKNKDIFACDKEDFYIVEYKDTAVSRHGLKRGTIFGKGAINNRISAFLMGIMHSHGIPTAFVEKLSSNESLIKKITPLPLSVVVRNLAAGSLSKTLGIKEGTRLKQPVVELHLREESLHDPLINDSHAIALELCTREELDSLYEYSLRVNEILCEHLKRLDVLLVDFGLDFCRDMQGQILLSYEISPDTCRFWDSKTGECLDHDRFCLDLGDAEDAYEEIARRILGKGL